MTMTISIGYRPPGRIAGAANRLRDVARAALQVARHGFDRYVEWRENRLALRALRDMDDYRLRDLGIDRSQIMSVVCGLEADLNRRNRHE